MTIFSAGERLSNRLWLTGYGHARGKPQNSQRKTDLKAKGAKMPPAAGLGVIL